MKKISVIIPVYNAEKYLKKCIESILKQTYKDIEIILINDGSFDKSREVCICYQNKNKNIKYFEHENKGCSYTRNRGIINSSGEYICFIDSDDVLEENFLEVLFLKMNELKADLIITKIKQLNNEKIQKIINYSKKEIKLNDDIKKINSILFNSPCNKLFKKELITKFKIFFPVETSIAEDLAFVFKYATVSKKIVFTDEVAYLYRYNPNSITSNIKIEKIQEGFNTFSDIKNFLKEKKIYIQNKKALLFIEKKFLIKTAYSIIGRSYKIKNFLNIKKEVEKFEKNLKSYDLILYKDYRMKKILLFLRMYFRMLLKKEKK
ncbi:MAG: glycosyltransferase family 2 protein [Clostridium sp.]|uniref:glycosyltransferase family 2 protein n=1 Tax=Clostridium sp. TaxID=1506 RepID=UPI003EE72782